MPASNANAEMNADEDTAAPQANPKEIEENDAQRNLDLSSGSVTSVSKISSDSDKKEIPKKKRTGNKRKAGKHTPKGSSWGCVHTSFWLLGCICFVWWLGLVLYNSFSSLSEAITGPLPDSPGEKLRKQGVRDHHPVVFVPGTVTGSLELWEGHPCTHGLFRKRLWGGTFGKVYKRPLCWLEHMKLDNETGLDPPGVRVRAVSGLVAADYFAPGYFVWAVLIENLASVGYEEKTMHMAAYDWRLAFHNTEVRDKTLSRLKSTIELLVETNGGKKVVVIPHSMGALYFLYFLKWVEAPTPMGGGGGDDWCAKHIKAVMNIAGPLLGVPKAVTGLFSSEAKDIAMARAAAPGVMEPELIGMHLLQHIMRVTRTWDSTMSMLLNGGETIWGGLEWSPEEGYDCLPKGKQSEENETDVNVTDSFRSKPVGRHGKPMAHYGRIISFGKAMAETEAGNLETGPLKVDTEDSDLVCRNVTCGDVWTEYHDLSWEGVQSVAEKVYTAETVLDLLRYVAPQMMQRGDSHFSHGIADDLDDPKYQHFKYWSNPLETKLPNAPEMEMYCMYGVGVLTERSYVYKISPNAEMGSIPFRIDAEADGDSEGCLQGGTQFVDGDETVPALSAGFMCAQGWRGKTRFNPSGAPTFVREYQHVSPASFLEGRGTLSASHVDIMGNFDLIEDILRVAAGQKIGGDRIFSNLLKWVKRIHLKL